MTEIVEIAAADTHDLRRRILRDDGELVAISSWMLRHYPDRPADEAFQLRGMATEPTHRGTGVSAALLLAGLDRCAAAGAVLVWARARVAALTFYERHGFVATGPEYVDLTTGLPHRDVLRPLV